MNKVYLGLGSNVGNRKENLDKSINLLQRHLSNLKKSRIYISKAVGYENQPDFFNMVVYGETDLDLESFFKFTKDIEKEVGRVYRFHWGPREIDIDILFFNNVIYSSENLTVPHKRIQERDFVLLPLIEIYPNLIHPIFKKKVKDLLDNLKERSIIDVL